MYKVYIIVSRSLLIITLFLTLSRIVVAQEGLIFGKVIDSSDEGIPFMDVILLESGKQLTVTVTDFDGNYAFQHLEGGIYELLISYEKHVPVKVQDILVSNSKKGSKVLVALESSVNDEGRTRSDTIVQAFVPPEKEIELTEEELKRLAEEDLKRLTKCSCCDWYNNKKK